MNKKPVPPLVDRPPIIFDDDIERYKEWDGALLLKISIAINIVLIIHIVQSASNV